MEAWRNINFTSIGSNPLYLAHNLYLNGEIITDLVIPNAVKEIKAYTFYRCLSLTSITIGSNVTSIGTAAFYNCTNLKTVENKSTHITVKQGDTGNGYVGYYADRVTNP